MQILFTVGAGDVTQAVDMAKARAQALGHTGVSLHAVEEIGGHRWRVIVHAADPRSPIPGSG